MKYMADSTEYDLQSQVKILSRRLEIVYNFFEQKINEFDAIGRDYESISKTIFNTVVSSCILDKSKNHILAL